MITEEDKEKLLKEIKKKIKEIRSYTPRVAIFGDTGVGKSSLCNAIFGKEIAKISDVEACTREPQEILIGDKEDGGIVLIDVPGVGEDPQRHQEYMNLYKSLLPKVDLVLWAIKADDRKFATSMEVYEKILKPNLKKCPVVFVITQIDKIEPIDEWYDNGKVLGKTQLQNLLKKSNDISSRFDISTNKIVAVSAKNNYNIVELVEKIVEVLPNEKKYSFAREAKEENVSKETITKAEKGVWDSIKEVAGDAYDVVKDVVVDIVVESAKKIFKDVLKKLPKFPFW